MKKLSHYIHFGVLLSQLSHIFCCGLPVVVAVLSLISGAGLLGALPGVVEHYHEILHDWEEPILVFSGAMLALGWGLDIQARKVDCHDTGCEHPPCAPVKTKAHIILKLATVLFFVNLAVLMFSH